MPSLHDLGEFKASFGELGDEKRTLIDLGLPSDDLPLPDHEPAIIADSMVEASTIETEEETSGSDMLNYGDLGDLLGSMDNQILGTPASVETPENGRQDENSFPDISGGDDDLNGFFDEMQNTENVEEPAESSQEDIDFGNFIDTIPDDFSTGESSGEVMESLGETEDFPGEAMESLDETEESSGEAMEEDFGLPADLLDGFADEIEAERALPHSDEEESPLSDSAADTGESFGDMEIGEADISGDLADEDSEIPDFSGFDQDESLELLNEEPELSASGIDAETGSDDLAESYGDLDGLDLLDQVDEEGEAFPETGTGEFGEETLGESDGEDSFDFSMPEGIPGLEDTGSGESGMEVLADLPAISGEDHGADLSEEEDSFDLGGEPSDFDSAAVLEEITGDSFDNFKLDANVLAGGFDLKAGDSDFGGGFGELDDFSLSGIDSVFDGKSPAAGRTAGRSGRGSGFRAGTDDVEEIRLTNEELDQFQTTLSSYPLNLRIACEELIAEQAVAPDMMSRLVKLLINGASAGETAALAGQILGKTISISRGFEKKTGEALEAEQGSFAYIFIHNFLPVFRLFLMIAMVLLSMGYLGWKFIYTPLRAEKIYKLGYERIGAGEYGRANERFLEAFRINQKKVWFYRYARAFMEARQYTLAEEKYQELLNFTASKNKRYIPEKAAVLEYADMQTNVIGNYQAADEILRHNILDYYPFDRDALLALGDNSLAWGEYESTRLEDAREYYARYMERYGRSDPLLERMLKYFIRTDNLEQVLSLQSHFMSSGNREISAGALAELGGYFLDKRLEKIRGVPNEYLEYIGGIREILLRAIRQDSMLPESYYHLARYYNYFENFNDERLTLDLAVRVFEAAKEESPRRIRYHVLTLGRYAEVLIENKEFFPAEESLVKGINIYQDGLSRRLLTVSPDFGKLYTNLGDLEYFIKDGDLQSALDYYRLGEQNGWAPPEIRYRMGAAYYQLRQWGPAQEQLFAAYREMQPNRRILYALGNVSYFRGNYFAAQGYYDRLLEILEADRSRFPLITPSDDEKQLDLVERIMVAQNNMGAALEGLTERTGDNRYRSRAQGLYADSERAWDILTRNPVSMTRMRPSPEITAPGVNPAYLNVQNSLHPVPGYESQIFIRIDKDVLEPSVWEELAPPGYRLSQGLYSGR